MSGGKDLRDSQAPGARLSSLIGMCLLVAAFSGLFAYSVGYDRAARQEVRLAGERADTERQVLALVVQRNPQATVADFLDFPRHLIAESERRRIDFRLVLAIIDHESEFNPRAVGKRGEVGLMQVMPATAAIVCKNLELDCSAGLADPRLNVQVGLAHLASLRDQFGAMGADALRAYNRGANRAREHWPADRYAEGVALKFVRAAHQVRGPGQRDHREHGREP